MTTRHTATAWATAMILFLAEAPTPIWIQLQLLHSLEHAMGAGATLLRYIANGKHQEAREKLTEAKNAEKEAKIIAADLPDTTKKDKEVKINAEAQAMECEIETRFFEKLVRYTKEAMDLTSKAVM